MCQPEENTVQLSLRTEHSTRGGRAVMVVLDTVRTGNTVCVESVLSVGKLC